MCASCGTCTTACSSGTATCDSMSSAPTPLLVAMTVISGPWSREVTPFRPHAATASMHVSARFTSREDRTHRVAMTRADCRERPAKPRGRAAILRGCDRARSLLSGTTMRRFALVLAFAGCASPAHDNGPDAAAGDDDESPGVDAAIDAPPAPVIEVLRGVDRASAFSIAEAKTLHDAHGVKWTGVYIGGPCSAGSGWTKSLLTSM